MSHDRGCPCGREKYEFDTCPERDCYKQEKIVVDWGYGEDPRGALVFIGRFQPFHKGHESVIRAGLEQAKEVVVVVGSSFAARNIRNPFTFEERKAMIKSVFPEERVKVVPVSDYPYDDNKWIAAVQRVVDEAIPYAKNVGLIGHSKDHTSYYLNIFPKWKNHVEVPNLGGINATDLRNNFLTSSSMQWVYLAEPVNKWLLDNFDAFSNVRQEYDMIKKYKEAWKAAPFPPTFMTVDTVVVQSGHVLLVKRGAMPGKGLLALPGGFLNQNETMLDGAIRELKEETKIKVPVPVLKGSIKESKTFDAPNRSARGRTITQAFFIDLGVGELPNIKKSRNLTDLEDDAEEARWVPLSKVNQQEMFEDHFHIIDAFIPQ